MKRIESFIYEHEHFSFITTLPDHHRNYKMNRLSDLSSQVSYVSLARLTRMHFNFRVFFRHNWTTEYSLPSLTSIKMFSEFFLFFVLLLLNPPICFCCFFDWFVVLHHCSTYNRKIVLHRMNENNHRNMNHCIRHDNRNTRKSRNHNLQKLYKENRAARCVGNRRKSKSWE